MQKLHKATQAAGLIESAKTFSLFRDGTNLYIINTGPASRELKEVRVRGIINELLAKFIFSKIDAGIAKKIAAGEANIDEKNISTLATQKGNSLINSGAISQLEITKNKFEYPQVIIKADKEYTFSFRHASMEEVQEFFKGLK